MDSDPSFMLSSARVLQMPPVSRDLISNAISQHCGKVKNVVFAILVSAERESADAKKFGIEKFAN